MIFQARRYGLIAALALGLLAAWGRPVLAEPAFSDVFEAHSSIMLLIEPKSGAIIDANGAAAAFYGYSRDQLRTMTIQDINALSPEQVAEERALAAKEERNFFIFRHSLKSGDIRTVAVHSHPVEIDGRPVLFSIITDISKQRELQQDLWHYQSRLEDMVDLQTQAIRRTSQVTIWTLGAAALVLLALVILLLWTLKRRQSAEQKLRANREHYRRLVNGLKEHFLYSHGIDGVFTYVSPSITGMLGYTPDEFLTHFDEYLTDAPLNKQVETFTALSMQGVEQPSYQLEIFHKNGSRRMLEVTEQPVFNALGQVEAVEGIAHDITERIALEHSLRTARDQAERANQAKSEFLASMSHELRTPMNAILGFAQVLMLDQAEPLSERQRASVDKILKGGKHLLELINQVLDLTKIEIGKLQLSVEDVSLDDVCQECLTLVQNQAAEHNIIVDKSLTHGAVIRADYTRLKQVLLNLLSNAVKYNDGGGNVTLSCQEIPGNRVHISISDDGPGIPPELQPKLFEPFERLGRESSAVEGTGVGLTIAKQLVETMGGRIGFESVPGDGSTFWVEFPIVSHIENDAPEHALGAATVLAKAEEPRGKILYIEDNPSNLELMETIISDMAGYKMISAHNAELGLSLAKSEQPRLILMDIGLPGMDGFEALKRLKDNETTRDIPVIAISAHAMKSHIEKGLEAGFETYLTKPLNIPELINAIEGTLGES